VIGVISHLAYINNFMPGTYVNVVYWTLGIEAQFYLLIAFLFPLMKASKRVLALLLTAFIAIACIPVAGSMSVILPFLSYFALGILLYFHKIKKAMPLPFFIAGCLLGLMQLYFYQDLPGTIAAALTICVILFWVHVNPLIKFLSTISYSLYLVHVPVGGKVINLGLRWVTSDLSKYALVILALSVSISAAFAFYKLVELPAFRLSKRFRYDPQQGEKSFEDKDSKKTEVFAATVS
jgi:peptidoglycan/LPS O-acetylase OafA/YrhL